MTAGWLLLTYGLAIVSALVPWFNAELLLLGAIVSVDTSTEIVLIVLAVTLGQLTGKTLMYWAARRASEAPSPRLQKFLDRWRSRIDGHPSSASLLIFVSAVTGFPPLYLVTIASGALRVGFLPFIAAGGVGRLLHFGVLALLPGVFGK